MDPLPDHPKIDDRHYISVSGFPNEIIISDSTIKTVRVTTISSKVS